MKALFIGGLCDGQWLKVTAGARRWEVPLPGVELPAFRGRPAQVVNHEHYRPVQMGGEARAATVFILDGLTLDDAMAMLITGYRRSGMVQQPAPPPP